MWSFRSARRCFFHTSCGHPECDLIQFLRVEPNETSTLIQQQSHHYSWIFKRFFSNTSFWLYRVHSISGLNNRDQDISTPYHLKWRPRRVPAWTFPCSLSLLCTLTQCDLEVWSCRQSWLWLQRWALTIGLGFAEHHCQTVQWTTLSFWYI